MRNHNLFFGILKNYLASFLMSFVIYFEQLCDLLKSRVDSPDFLQKLENAQASVPQSIAGMLTKTCQ